MLIANSPPELDTRICLMEVPPGAPLCGKPAVSVWQSSCEGQCATTPFGTCAEHERLVQRPGLCAHCGYVAILLPLPAVDLS